MKKKTSSLLRSGISLLQVIVLILSTTDGTVLSLPMTKNISTNLTQAVKKSRSFPCEKPQFRSYNLHDLMKNVYKSSSETASTPVYIVLKRCDVHSGCCANSNMTCSPVKSAIYYENIEIGVLNLATKKTKRWIRVEQHSKCACEYNTFNDGMALPNVVLL